MSHGTQDLTTGLKPTFLVVPGFGEGPKVFAPLLAALNDQLAGRVVFVPSPRSGGHSVWRAGYPRALVRLSDNIVARADALGLIDTIGVAHSLGGVTILLAAKERPQLFSRIILVAPAGMMTSDSLLKLAARVIRKTWRNVRDGLFAKDKAYRRACWACVTEGWTYILANPVRGVSEAMAAASIIGDGFTALVDEVGAMGIEVDYVVGTHDVVFAYSDALRHIKGRPLRVIQGGFHDLQNQPWILVAQLRSLLHQSSV